MTPIVRVTLDIRTSEDPALVVLDIDRFITTEAIFTAEVVVPLQVIGWKRENRKQERIREPNRNRSDAQGSGFAARKRP